MVARTDIERANEIESAYRVRDGLYLLGSLERGVTVYNQQVRAHNLVWALWELERRGGRRVGYVAVVGAGMSGLSALRGKLSRRLGRSCTKSLQYRVRCGDEERSASRHIHIKATSRRTRWTELNFGFAFVGY
jgi:hypothetical protein